MEVNTIRKFLAANYSDEKLAALLAHTETGRLSYNTCCCLVGIATADHTLMGAFESDSLPYQDSHVCRARRLPLAGEAEAEFRELGPDEARRAALLPLIREEMERRGQDRVIGSSGDRVIPEESGDPVIETLTAITTIFRLSITAISCDLAQQKEAAEVGMDLLR